MAADLQHPYVYVPWTSYNTTVTCAMWMSYRERYSTVTWTRFARAVLHGRKGTVAPYRLHYKDIPGTDQPISSMDEHGPKLRYTIGGGRPALQGKAPDHT